MPITSEFSFILFDAPREIAGKKKTHDIDDEDADIGSLFSYKIDQFNLCVSGRTDGHNKIKLTSLKQEKNDMFP